MVLIAQRGVHNQHRLDQPLGLAISDRVGLILSNYITLSAILLGTFQLYRKFKFLSYAVVGGPEKGPLGDNNVHVILPISYW